MPAVQRSPVITPRGLAASSRPGLAPPIVNEVLSAPGKALDPADRQAMGLRLRHDFSKVRVHADARAAASARAVDAQAYTVGSHVVFGEGKYSPRSAGGQRLLVHELVHTLQQSGGVPLTGQLTLGDPREESERQAERMASTGPVQKADVAASNRSVRVQRQMNETQQKPAVDLAQSASPFLAGAIGSVAIDGFETGKSDISAANQKALEKTARTIQTLLKTYPGSSIRVIGHTDAVGKEENNLALGQSRAESVQTALVAMGLPAEAIGVESKGETQLLVKTQRAEARNRRVEVRFQPHTTPSLGTISGQYSTAPSSPGAFRVDVPSPMRVTPPASAPAPSAGATQTVPGQQAQPSPVGEIKALTELIKKTADAAKRDPLVSKLRDALARLQPVMPAADFKKEIDKAIDALVKQGTESGIMAILQAVAGKAPTPAVDTHDQPGGTLPQKDLNQHILKGPAIPIPDTPKPAPKFSYEYRNGLKQSYAPGAKIEFTLVPPDKPMSGGKRVVILAYADRNEQNPVPLSKVLIESDKSTPVEMKAPDAPGKYVIRVNIGFGFDYSSIQEFEVAAAEKK
jgi:outer membrane protein OmpA-like peptidoglycan-associated protein